VIIMQDDSGALRRTLCREAADAADGFPSLRLTPLFYAIRSF
jgi:hypothetical protein